MENNEKYIYENHKIMIKLLFLSIYLAFFKLKNVEMITFQKIITLIIIGVILFKTMWTFSDPIDSIKLYLGGIISWLTGYYLTNANIKENVLFTGILLISYIIFAIRFLFFDLIIIEEFGGEDNAGNKEI